MMRQAGRRVEAALAGVGSTEIYEAERGEISIQLRKMLTLTEIPKLPPERLPPNWDGHAEGPK